MSAANASSNDLFTFECSSHMMITPTITQTPFIRKRKVGLLLLYIFCLVTFLQPRPRTNHGPEIGSLWPFNTAKSANREIREL